MYVIDGMDVSSDAVMAIEALFLLISSEGSLQRDSYSSRKVCFCTIYFLSNLNMCSFTFGHLTNFHFVPGSQGMSTLCCSTLPSSSSNQRPVCWHSRWTTFNHQPWNCKLAYSVFSCQIKMCSLRFSHLTNFLSLPSRYFYYVKLWLRLLAWNVEFWNYCCPICAIVLAQLLKGNRILVQPPLFWGFWPACSSRPSEVTPGPTVAPWLSRVPWAMLTNGLPTV